MTLHFAAEYIEYLYLQFQHDFGVHHCYTYRIRNRLLAHKCDDDE